VRQLAGVDQPAAPGVVALALVEVERKACQLAGELDVDRAVQREQQQSWPHRERNDAPTPDQYWRARNGERPTSGQAVSRTSARRQCPGRTPAPPWCPPRLEQRSARQPPTGRRRLRPPHAAAALPPARSPAACSRQAAAR